MTDLILKLGRASNLAISLPVENFSLRLRSEFEMVCEIRVLIENSQRSRLAFGQFCEFAAKNFSHWAYFPSNLGQGFNHICT